MPTLLSLSNVARGGQEKPAHPVKQTGFQRIENVRWFWQGDLDRIWVK